jgi:hypothetical protein
MTRKTAAKKTAARRAGGNKTRRKRADVTEKRLNTAELERALSRAEREVARPEHEGGRGPQLVDLHPDSIETRTELFQPRRFSHTLYEVDQRHVNRLAGRLTNKGELDPILVIKLKTEALYNEAPGDQWVVVDGHHRLAAYKQAGWAGTIKCEWFAGSVREAWDASIAENEKIKLTVPLPDRQARAWDRVLLKQGSKREIHKLCGVADGTVGYMRKVLAAFEAKDDFAKELKKRLGKPLKSATWGDARMAFIGATPRQRDQHERAGKLAGVMRSRMADKLSEDFEVTARALYIYDATLPAALIVELEKVLREEALEDGDADDRPEDATTKGFDEL